MNAPSGECSPVACLLDSPCEWSKDRTGRRKAAVHGEIELLTRFEIALNQLRTTLKTGQLRGLVPADAGHSAEARNRERLRELGLRDLVGVQECVSV